MAERRKFNGKSYKHQTTHTSKTAAQNMAKKYRKDGMPARVVPVSKTNKKYKVFAKV